MAIRPSSEQLLDLERSALRGLCCGIGSSGEAFPSAIRELSHYSWHGAEHRIVYETLARLSASGGESVAEQLPAQAARMGFPDVDWMIYLHPHKGAQPDISDIIRALKDSAKESQWRE